MLWFGGTVNTSQGNIFDVDSWQNGADCLYELSSPNDDDNESLINYYYLTQFTDAIQNEYTTNLIYTTEEEKLQTLIDLCSQVKDGGTPVLLGFSGKFYGTFQAGHAVTAYGVEYGSWVRNGVVYNGRILIYDSNQYDFSKDTCLYFNTTSWRWAIPEYQITSSNSGKINFVSNDLDLLNGYGYLGDNSYTQNSKYIAVMRSATNSNDYSIKKIVKSSTSNGWTVNNSTSADDIQPFYDFMESSTNSSFKVALPDSTSGW